jgi:hypothetical protein
MPANLLDSLSIIMYIHEYDRNVSRSIAGKLLPILNIKN